MDLLKLHVAPAGPDSDNVTGVTMRCYPRPIFFPASAATNSTRNPDVSSSGQHLFYYMSMDVGQSPLDAVVIKRQSLVINAQQM